MTVRDAFQELLSRIELNPTRVKRATQHYGAIKEQIETTLGKTVRQVGSFQRSTKIRPPGDGRIDVDAIVDFGPAYRIAHPPETGVTPTDALEMVRRALVGNKVYRLLEPKADAPTVVLEYADEFSIEIVPAYVDKTGSHPHGSGEPGCYLVPTASGNWEPADYDYDAYVISNQNAQCGGELVPAIKLFKAFLRGHPTIALKSFHVEILCTRLIPTAIREWREKQLTWGYQHILAYLLANARRELLGPIALPGSYSPGVNSGMSIAELIATGQRLSDLGGLAWRICDLKEISGVLDLWGDFYGEPFPAAA